LNLDAILITHHHPDHTGGILELKQKYQCETYGFKHARFPHVDKPYLDGDHFVLLGTRFEVFEVPGHTLDHIAFYSSTDKQHSTPWLFPGDTLFSGGCGRLFEGTAVQMQSSLNKLSKLPRATEIYCAHEYTLANLAFAKALMSENTDLLTYMEVCSSKRDQNQPTIPSTMATELQINPFLRSDDPALVSSLSKMRPEVTLTTDNVVFAETRKAKDQF